MHRFVHVPDTWKYRAIEIWQDKVFDLLLDEHKIEEDVAAGMRAWRHSGFSVDNSVRLEATDLDGMQRLIEYIARCPFSLARMITIADDGKVVYRATAPNCIPFPITGDKDLTSGNPRNFEIFDPLDFLAAVTQHIPEKGEHQIRYYGWYSNKNRGMRYADPVPAGDGKPAAADEDWQKLEPDTPYKRKCRMTWAALIKAVYEVDPLKCPKCGGTMKVVSFIEKEQSDVISKILRHCGLWKEAPPRAPPEPVPDTFNEPALDYGFFDRVCI